jgi:hypothetical protein
MYMLNQVDHWRQSQNAALWVAAAPSLFVALLFLVWERELLWMFAVLLPPIWAPTLYAQFGNVEPQPTGRALGAFALGLVILLAVGLGLFLFA